jgi:hypothetical protein
MKSKIVIFLALCVASSTCFDSLSWAEYVTTSSRRCFKDSDCGESTAWVCVDAQFGTCMSPTGRAFGMCHSDRDCLGSDVYCSGSNPGRCLQRRCPIFMQPRIEITDDGFVFHCDLDPQYQCSGYSATGGQPEVCRCYEDAHYPVRHNTPAPRSPHEPILGPDLVNSREDAIMTLGTTILPDEEHMENFCDDLDNVLFGLDVHSVPEVQMQSDK